MTQLVSQLGTWLVNQLESKSVTQLVNQLGAH